MKVSEPGHDYLAPQRPHYGVDGGHVPPPAKGKSPVEEAHGNAAGRGPAVELSLSAEARAILAGDPSAPGKSGQSTAHRARQFITDNLVAHPELGDIPFGKVVAVLARGGDPRSLFNDIVPAALENAGSEPPEGENGTAETNDPVVAGSPEAPTNPLQELLDSIGPATDPSATAV